MKTKRFWDIFRTRTVTADEYESDDPIERSFFIQLKKYLVENATIHPHYEIVTKAEIFKVNFLIEVNNKRIAIEFQKDDSDGETPVRWKDSLMIGTSQTDTIYRFTGMDILPFIDDCVYFLCQFEPDIFNATYPHFHRVLKYEEKERNIIYYSMVDEDGQFAYRLRLKMDLINRKTCPSLFEPGATG